jgi:diguanylate cyclase (GGDEF)-like protein
VVTLLEDVTEQRQVSERIAYVAHHDSLTGLPNRAAFDEFFPKMLLATTELGGELAVMCMDLDGFKDINDQYGHAAGDEVLRAMSLRLQAVAERAFLARIGGDEFVLVKENCAGAKAAGELAARLIEASRDAFDVEGKRLSVGLSIGVALSPTHGSDCKTLLVNADLALYQAKNQQRGTIRYFSPALDSQVRAERALREDLRRALDRSELHAFYQPQADMEREIIGFEALLRWRSPVRGDVSPMTFIPVAEQTGLIMPIGEWILREAYREAALWPGSTRVAVNISPEQFKSTDLPKLVQLVLIDTGLSASRLELEITESVFIDDFARALSVLMRLKAIGIDIALDDFGTGYSSLSYLQAFPFDRIKIDRSFVSELGMNARSDAIMRAIISMGKSLDISILAEGVETERQFEMLTEFGCNAVQGYLFGQPQPPQEIWRDARGVSARNALA